MPAWGDVFNYSERMRREDPENQNWVDLNRYAQTRDNPAIALAAAPYEGLKYVEQNTPIKPLSGIADVYEKLYGSNALSAAIRPNEVTSPASWRNVTTSGQAAIDEIMARLGFGS
jgi:hypothetical protein